MSDIDAVEPGVSSKRPIEANTKAALYRKFLPKRLRNFARYAVTRFQNRSFKPYWITVETCGPPIRFLIASREGEDWHVPYVTQENREMTFVRDKLLHPGARVVEVGTHHGFSASLIGTWIGPTGTMACYEPMEENCAVASANIEANGLKQIRLNRAAAGEHAGTIYMAKTGSNSNVQSGGFMGTPCPVVRLDDEIKGPVDLLKIDVEGYELHVLRGATNLLATRPNLQIEVHPGPIEEFGGRTEQLFDLIPTSAYDFWIQRGTLTEPEIYLPGTPILYNSHLFGRRKA